MASKILEKSSLHYTITFSFKNQTTIFAYFYFDFFLISYTLVFLIEKKFFVNTKVEIGGF